MKRVVRLAALSALIAVAMALPSLVSGWPETRAGVPEPVPTPIPGTSQTCVDIKLDILSGFLTDVLELGILDDLGVYDIDEEVFRADLPDEGWVWVNRNDRFREVEGVVERSHTATIDFPATHESHDQNTIIKVDPEYTGVLAELNQPNPEGTTNPVPPTSIEMEWEHGTFPDEDGRNEPERYFPRWAWPVAGDRVWTEGNWVIDCGHGTTIDGAMHFRTEIHPARAVAAMRQQVHALPGSGDTQVPVTATDLYIHGRSGFVTEILEHGQEVITEDVFEPDHDPNDHLLTPIDAAYDFEVCLPEQPSPGAVPSVSWEAGPGNTVNIEPELDFEPAVAPCTGAKQLNVSVDLTGVAADEVYARKIYAGWVTPADSLRRFVVSLDQMDLHEDHEVEFSLGGDCECTFFYLNLDKSADEWFRLADWWEETCNIEADLGLGTVCIDYNQLYDYDSDEILGNGLLNFSGPTFDFLVANGQPFHIRSNGYDQDCADDLFDQPLLNDHFWDAVTYSLCYYGSLITNFEKGRNDNFHRLNVCFVETDTGLCDPLAEEEFTGYGVGSRDLAAGGEYDMEFTVSEESVPANSADLAVAKACEHDGEVALAGEPFTCTVTVTNAGPGLPQGVTVADTLSTLVPASGYSIDTATFVVELGDESGATQNCTITPPNAISCDIDSVPVGGSATVSMQVTPTQPGDFANSAVVSSDTSDPNSANDSASATVKVYLPVTLDVRPGATPNSVNITAGGSTSVAILTTPDFNPFALNVSTLCFGDAEEPTQRDCSETHGIGHSTDVDKDRDKDLVLHYEVAQVGIDLTDTTACIIGTTTSGIGVYGCDSVRPL